MEGIDDTIWELCHVCPCIDNFGPCIHYLWPLLIPARKLHGEDSNDNDDDFKDNHYFWSPTCTPYLPHSYFCCPIFREGIDNDDKDDGPVFIILQELCSWEADGWLWRGHNGRRSSPPISTGYWLGSTMTKTYFNCCNNSLICSLPPPPHWYLWGGNICENIGTIPKILWGWNQHMCCLIRTHRLRPFPLPHTQNPQLLRPIMTTWSTKST